MEHNWETNLDSLETDYEVRFWHNGEHRLGFVLAVVRSAGGMVIDYVSVLSQADNIRLLGQELRTARFEFCTNIGHSRR